MSVTARLVLLVVVLWSAPLWAYGQAADPPTELAAPQNGTTIRVYWTPPTSGPTPTGYRISYYQAAGDPQTVSVGSGTATSWDLTTGVQDGVSYNIGIQTLSGAAYPSDVVTVLSRTAPVVMMGDHAIPNHGIVDRESIGEDPDSRLQCLTNNLDCCITDPASGAFWFCPGGGEVLSGGTTYYRSRGGQGFGVNLHRRAEGTEEGVFHCQIPDGNGDPYSYYVGVYTPGEGAVTIQSLNFTALTEDRPSFVLTCITVGGPASSVTWTRDGGMVTEDSDHVILQSVIYGVSAEYNNSLTVSMAEYGTYRCTVSNDQTSTPVHEEIKVEGPDPPTNLALTQLSTISFRVTWDDPNPEDDVTGYRVHYTIAGVMEDQEEEVTDREWSITLSEEEMTYDITISVQTLSTTFPSAEATVDVPTTPSGPVSNLQSSPSLSQITVTWSPVDSANMVITRYEVQYTSSDGSPVMEYTGSPMFVIRDRTHGANHTFSVTPFSLFARGKTEEQTVQTLSQPPQVQGVSIDSIDATSVEVAWQRVNLPLEELTGYRVDYREVVQGCKRQAVENGSQTFPDNANSGKIDGLTPGVWYQFQLTALAVTSDGTPVEGATATCGSQVTGYEDGGGFSTGELAGAIVASIVLTILLYTVILLTGIAVLRLRRRKSDYSVAVKSPRTPTDIPLKDCLAYGEVKEPQTYQSGGGGGEDAHIYEQTSLADNGDYEN